MREAGNGRGAIKLKTKRHLALVPSGRWTRMQMLLQWLSVKNFRRMRQSGMAGSGRLAQHARSGQQEVFCFSLFLVLLFKTNKQKTHTTKFGLVWVYKTCSFFYWLNLLYSEKFLNSKLLGQCCAHTILFALSNPPGFLQTTKKILNKLTCSEQG